MENELEFMKKEAEKMPLPELARIIIFGSYTPGIHDTILISRLEEIDNRENNISVKLYQEKNNE